MFSVLPFSCGAHKPSWSLSSEDAGTPAPYQLAEIKLDSHGAARWWTLPDGSVPGPSEYYPCSDCHDEDMPPNPTIRKLTEDHDKWKLRHGGGRIWCLNCHDEEDRDKFRDAAGRPVEADHVEEVCAGCHSLQYKDFVHGAHGKRVGSYRGKRVLTSCIACHDPHAPAIMPRKPAPGPAPARYGGGQP